MGFAKLDSCNMTFKTTEVPLDSYSSLIINILTNQTKHSRAPLLLSFTDRVRQQLFIVRRHFWVN